MSMQSGGDLFIVDNSDTDKTLDYLRGWSQIPQNSPLPDRKRFAF